MQAHWGNLSRRALESLAVEAYRDGILTASEVGYLLGHISRQETEDFLYKSRAYLHYSEKDLENDIETIRGMAR